MESHTDPTLAVDNGATLTSDQRKIQAYAKPRLHTALSTIFRVTQGYAVMREAATTLDATIKALQCPMKASFVALPGRSSPEGRPMRHLCLAQCDNEAVIRDPLSVGESGELLFYPPMENKVPVGWKYTIRPPIPKNEYTGNLVSKTCRHKGDQREFVTSPFPRPDIVQH